ncbi:MAG: carbon monoxide dehydrogenase [Eubacterium sp.]|nr:carbon monoxide dehydrogenase [Eubacterium sp.]
MILYNQLIDQIKNLLPPCEKCFDYKKTSLKQGDKNSILLLKDTAYELGGSQKPCISTMAVTSSMQFDNSICLYGKDISEIKEDTAFAKIVFLEIEAIDEESAFDKIKELELVRYNYCPEGFMTRASALSMREQLRVSKKVVKKGITFADYGSALLQEYLKNPIVNSVQIIFITQFDKFDELLMLADKIKSTTSALNHILDNVIFDCSTCNLKEICDEVEGMKELHMKKVKNE